MMARSGHILMTTDAVGGVWQYTQTLALGLVDHDWKVTVLCMGPPPPSETVAALQAESVDLRLCDLPLDWMASTPEEVHSAGRLIAQTAEEVGADSIHLHSPSYAACSSFPAPVVAVSHSCLGTWWEAVRACPPPADFTWRILLHGEGLVRVAQVICPTNAFADQTAAYYALERRPLAIHNGRVTVEPTPARPSQPFAFTAGRLWDEGKNVRVLDEAAPASGLPVLAAGDLEGPQGEIVQLKGLRALGRLSERHMRGKLSLRPIYVAPALYEPFGLSILEAAQAGCPLVLGDIPTLRELWDGAALFVPPRDPHAVAEALRQLQCDDTERARLGAAALQRAGCYGAQTFIDATAAVHVGVRLRQARDAVPA